MGRPKGQEFSGSSTEIATFVKLTILIGEDSKKLASVLNNSCQIEYSDSLDAAVVQANHSAIAVIRFCYHPPVRALICLMGLSIVVIALKLL